jgi:hypothetical protein
MKIFIQLILVGLSISGCVYTRTFKNRDDDLDDAKKVTDQFFNALKKDDFKSIYPLFSQRFFQVTPKDSLNYIFVMSKNKLGTVETTGITNWGTQVTEGTTQSGDYMINFTVHRTKFDSKEQIRLVEEEDGKIRIAYYHITSDGF